MRQEINLLGEEFINVGPWLSFSRCLIFCCFLLIALISISLVDEYKIINIEKEIALLSESNDINRSKMSEPGDIGKYQLRLRELEKVLVDKYKLWLNYQSITRSGRVGFSNYFYHISDLSNVNLSLDEIEIYNNGENLSLKGYSTKAEYIPIYIDDLKKQKEFLGMVFGDLSINKVEYSNLMRFSLERKPDIENEGEMRVRSDFGVSEIIKRPLSDGVMW